MDNNAEELGKQLLLGLPKTAKKGAVTAAGLATFAGYGPAHGKIGFGLHGGARFDTSGVNQGGNAI